MSEEKEKEEETSAYKSIPSSLHRCVTRVVADCHLSSP